MDNSLEALITKKIIQKELLNELVSIGLIDFLNTINIVGKLDEDISKLKKLQETDKDIKNIIVKIPV